MSVPSVDVQDLMAGSSASHLPEPLGEILRVTVAILFFTQRRCGLTESPAQVTPSDRMSVTVPQSHHMPSRQGFCVTGHVPITVICFYICAAFHLRWEE